MPGQHLRRGDNNEQVRALQDMLNRTGTLLSLDGDFGPATEKAVREAQREAGLPVTGEADPETWRWLEAQPEPSPDLPCAGVTFVVREEVGSRVQYDRVAARPHFPGESSGVTIGIGYDLQFQGNSFENDWAGELSAEQIARLRSWLGKRGTSQAAQELADIVVPFRSAWRVFTVKTLPKYVDQTRGAFPSFNSLPDLCRAVLVSLVYNRGPRLDDSSGEDRRREMRQIRIALDRGDLAAVPELLQSMKRLWPGSRGLQDRRDREAGLWRQGLAV